MKRFLFSLALTLLAIPVCHAGPVVGCSEESGVTFQSTPCPEGATKFPSTISVSSSSVTVVADAAPEAEMAIAPAAIPAPRRRASINSSRDELHAGMSDLQVLNNRRWGKPQRITRNREARAWHELWRYETGANGGKQLRFVNGTLVHVEEIEAPMPVLSMASAVASEGRQ